MKLNKLLPIFIFLQVILISSLSFVYGDCFAVLVGKKASVDGAVLFGHNEQNGGRRIVNFRYVPRLKHKPGEMIILKNGASLPQVGETLAMLWLENPGVEFGDSYFNERGVAVSSDACPTGEDSFNELVARGDIVEGGIGYMLRRLVAQRAKTAREGVKIAGDLISRFGYSSSGRSLIIADPNEAWVLSAARGKHWIAERCPDDEVVLLPNLHVISSEADLNDSQNVMYSPGLVDYSIQKGWYDPSSGKQFSFRKAFNRPPRKGSFRAKYGADPRQWYAQSIVKGKIIDLPLKEELPFSVKPAHKMTVADVAKILRSHLEGTVFDTSQNYKICSPHKMKRVAAAICSTTTQDASVYQLRNWLPQEIGCLVWKASAAPCSSVLIPWYLGITKTPQAFYKPGDIKRELDVNYHFSYPPQKFDFDQEFAFDIFNELENLVDLNYKKAIKIVRRVWDPFEKTEFALQPSIEEAALRLFKKDKDLAKQFLTDYSNSRALLALEKAKELNKKLKTMFWAN